MRAATAARAAATSALNGSLEVVVTGPVLEQVAENVERVGGGRYIAQERMEGLCRRRALGGQMQVGDEGGEGQRLQAYGLTLNRRGAEDKAQRKTEKNRHCCKLPVRATGSDA